MTMQRYTRAVVGLTGAVIVAGCAVNPATGERQFSLISEAQEIQMGREYDPQIAASMGIYTDQELSDYVNDLGQRLAEASERPDLPWTFRVVDDAAVNAFAVPGGFIYLTRGILAQFASEAELAGVLGHEIGHVTARHSVSQLSRQQLQQGLLGVGMVFSEDVRRFGELAQGVLQVVNLRYSRGDESQADGLGFRYMTLANYDPNALIGVFQMLANVSGGAGARVPEWQLTHPYPQNREAAITRTIESSERDFSDAVVERDEYVRRMEDVVYGPNPREGYFKDGLFLHADLAFRLQFPSDWTAVNQKTQVGAISPDEDAILTLTLAEDVSTPARGLTSFLEQEGMTGGRLNDRDINGLDAARAPFEALVGDQELEGEAAFIAYGGNVYQFVGYGTSARWGNHSAEVSAAIGTFQRLTDRARPGGAAGSPGGDPPRSVDDVR